MDDNNDNAVDRILKSDSMAKRGIHAIQWKGDHWRCGCGHEFGDSDEQIAAWLNHAPEASLMVFSSHYDEDVRLAVARLDHALDTRMPKREGRAWIRVPVEYGTSGGKSTGMLLPDSYTPPDVWKASDIADEGWSSPR